MRQVDSEREAIIQLVCTPRNRDIELVPKAPAGYALNEQELLASALSPKYGGTMRISGVKEYPERYCKVISPCPSLNAVVAFLFADRWSAWISKNVLFID